MKKTALATMLAGCLMGSVQAGDVIDVIISEETRQINKIKSVSLVELIDIFTRRKTLWDSGTEIVVVTRRGSSAEHMTFLYEKLGITPYQYKSRLNRNIYKGKAKPPIEVMTDEEVVDIVLSINGAIGYIYNYYVFKDQDVLYIVDENSNS